MCTQGHLTQQITLVLNTTELTPTAEKWSGNLCTQVASQAKLATHKGSHQTEQVLRQHMQLWTRRMLHSQLITRTESGNQYLKATSSLFLQHTVQCGMDATLQKPG